MADSSLDDFFAKKDKSKKPKKKFTPDEIAKKLEESGKESGSRSKKDKEKAPTSSVVNLKILEQDDEEWKDFEDEKRDYSGLRIQALNLKDKEEEMREQKLQENGSENKKDDALGPWKIKPPSPVPEKEDVIPEVFEKEEIPKPKEEQGFKYVPPHLRNKPASSSSPSSSSSLEPIRGNRRMKNAPEINDEFEFPSLGACNNEPSMDHCKDFQSVKHGSREVTRTSAQPIDLDNKYNILSSNSGKLEGEDD